MSTPEIEPLFSQIARQKKEAKQWSARLGWSLLASSIAGALVGLATWFIQEPRDRDDVHVGLALGLGLATFMLGGLVDRILFGPKPKAKCPQCGHAWEDAHDGGHDWLTWNCCPGCGLKMGD